MIIEKIALAAGCGLTVLMTAFHISFPVIFKWKTEAKNVSSTNKRILFTIHLALILFFAVVSVFTAVNFLQLLDESTMSICFLVLISGFWLWRTVWQLVYFKPKKGSAMSALHYILTAVFFLLFLGYFVPVIL